MDGSSVGKCDAQEEALVHYIIMCTQRPPWLLMDTHHGMTGALRYVVSKPNVQAGRLISN